MSEKSRPIVIGGTPSSGTTLLRAILNAHSQIACGPELGVFDRALIYHVKFSRFRAIIQANESIRSNTYHVRGNSAFKVDMVKMILDTSTYAPTASNFFFSENSNLRYYVDAWPDVLTTLNSSADYEQFFDKLIGNYAEKQGKARWAEKTPENIYFAHNLLKQFPNYLFIHVTRNPLDNVASLINRKFNPFSFEEAVDRCRYALFCANMCQNLPRFHEISYERLLKKPRNVIKKLMSFLGAEFEERQLEFYKTEMPASRGYGATPLFNSSVNRWRQDLSPEQVNYIKQELKLFWQAGWLEEQNFRQKIGRTLRSKFSTPA